MNDILIENCPYNVVFPMSNFILSLMWIYSGPEDGGCMFLRNVSIYLEIYTALKPEDKLRHVIYWIYRLISG
jgi:hypothetical protein